MSNGWETLTSLEDFTLTSSQYANTIFFAYSHSTQFDDQVLQNLSKTLQKLTSLQVFSLECEK